MSFLKKHYLVFGLIVIVSLNVLFAFYSYRIDLTSDKRYTISKPTQELMHRIENPVNITIYLSGDLNAGFLRLKRATSELIDDLNTYSKETISYKFVDPSDANSADERNANYEELMAAGMTPTMIYENNQDGKSSQKVVFPWASIEYNGKKRNVQLLKNVQGNSGEHNLNISIETLEYELTDALKIMMQKSVSKIAFIEGHGELNERETFDVCTALSKYFQIDRGVLGNDPRILNDYKAIVIAAPQIPFSESDKFIIDQYIMRGGRVLWLVDGVKLDPNALSVNGISPAIPLDLNITDQLFRYGVRINPVLLQDEQCMLIPVNVAPEGENPDFQAMPWYFAPLLNTSPYHAVTRNLTQLSSNFISTIDFVGESTRQRKEVLLATSNATHQITTPSTVDVSTVEIAPDYFNTSYLPVGVALEGIFESVFAHRMQPESILGNARINKQSVPTKQIVVAAGTLISNEIENGQALPAGYDRYTQKQFANRDFAVNALLYLTDDDGWINLRNKNFSLRLLNKNNARTNRVFYQWLNVALPIVMLIAFGILFMFLRKHRYTQSWEEEND